MVASDVLLSGAIFDAGYSSAKGVSASDLYSDEVLHAYPDSSKFDHLRHFSSASLKEHSTILLPSISFASSIVRAPLREPKYPTLAKTEQEVATKVPSRSLPAVPRFQPQDTTRKRPRPDSNSDALLDRSPPKTRVRVSERNDKVSSSAISGYQSKQQQVSPKRSVEAYAKLLGNDFEFFVRSFTVVLGRSSENDHGIDCALGKSKSISRRHATITYDTKKNGFQIQCFGKHPILVDGHPVPAGSPPVVLKSKTHLQIGDQCCFFLLPKGRTPDSDSSSESSRQSPTNSSADDLPVDGKPSLPIKAMIAQAILSSPEKKLTVQDMYSWIMDQWPYYRSLPSNSRWQNCIRHNLSMNPCFVKLLREEEGVGKKGAFWTLKGSYEDVLLPPRKVARTS